MIRLSPGMRHLPALLLLTLAAAGSAVAQNYPTKAVRVIVPTSPGSGADIVARIFAQKLSENVGQQFIIDNRAGAGANLAAELTAKAAPDGYTLFIATPAHAINPSLYNRLSYDILRDFTPISQISSGYYCIVVHPSVPAKNVKELIALAKAQPGKLNYASAGPGNATHLAGELFKSLAHVDMVHVPYKGSGPGVIDLVGGQVQVMFPNLTSAIGFIKSGKLRALATTGEHRAAAAPDIPTAIEAGLKGYTVIGWYGLAAPARTPQPIIAKLNAETVKVLKQPDIKERLAVDGAEPAPSTPAEFAAWIKGEVAKWSKVIKDAGLAGSA
jgi:tripartite-type tricarboxylate transporter receptor subunit TctC